MILARLSNHGTPAQDHWPLLKPSTCNLLRPPHIRQRRPQTLAATPHSSAVQSPLRRCGHAAPPHRSPGQATQLHRLAAWKLSEASSLNPGPARAGISLERRRG